MQRRDRSIKLFKQVLIGTSRYMNSDRADFPSFSALCDGGLPFLRHPCAIANETFDIHNQSYIISIIICQRPQYIFPRILCSSCKSIRHPGRFRSHVATQRTEYSVKRRHIIMMYYRAFALIPSVHWIPADRITPAVSAACSEVPRVL